MGGRDLAIDRISDMPDPLLTQILSLLTTEEAVRTCILSKRWTDLWTSTDTLDFDFGSRNFEYDGKNRFLRFIHGVLNRRGFSPLDKFKLMWQSSVTRCDYSDVEECVSHAVSCMPRLIYINIGTNLFFNLPDLLLNCGSVKEMSLLAAFSLSVSKTINLPSLQKLEIGDTSIDDDLIKMFLLGCPLLEELALTRCRLLFKEINSNVLKKLTIKRGDLCTSTTSFTLKNASSLVTADLDIQISYYTGELNLLGGLPNVTSLRLNASRHVLRLLNKDIPNFLILNNLKSLELGELETRYDWDLVACFLQHSPNLKKLVLNCHVISLSLSLSLCWGKE